MEALGLEDDVAVFRRYVAEMAEYLPNNQEALMRFSEGLATVANFMEMNTRLRDMGILYRVLASLSAIEASNNGLDLQNYNYRSYNANQHVGDIVIPANQLATIGQIDEIATYLRAKGYTTALGHGHFRLLTPSSIAFLINAHTYADIVLVGLESEIRTIQNKGKEHQFWTRKLEQSYLGTFFRFRS